MKLLATVNRRVAHAQPDVSPHCHVSFINAPDVENGPQSEVYRRTGEPAIPFSMPMIVHGVDLTYMTEKFMQAFEAGATPWSGGQPDEEEIERINANLRRRQ